MRILLLACLLVPLMPADHAGTLSVQGSATVRVAPEQAIISLGIENDADTVELAQQQNALISQKVVEQLRKLAPALQLQLGVMSLGPLRDTDRNRRIILKQIAHQVLTVTCEPGQVQAVAATALQAGATHIFDVDFAVKDARKFRDEARLLACKAAREKAELLATALGAKLGPAIAINEPNNWHWSGRWRSPWWCWEGYWYANGGSGYQQMSQNIMVHRPSGQDDSGAGETQSLSAEIHVTFGLLP